MWCFISNEKWKNTKEIIYVIIFEIIDVVLKVNALKFKLHFN